MRNTKVTGGSWLIFSNVWFGPGFSKVCQAGKSVLLTPLFPYFHLLLISQESHISSSSVYFYYVLSPSSLLPHPFPSFSTGWYFCSLNSGFRAHALSSWSHICHICQYLHYCSIKHVVFSAFHASKWVKTGSQQRERQSTAAQHIHCWTLKSLLRWGRKQVGILFLRCWTMCRVQKGPICKDTPMSQSHHLSCSLPPTHHLQRKMICFLPSEGLGCGLGREEKQLYK